MEFDFTSQGRKPSTLQIIRRWLNAGSPSQFTVTYGETFAEFQLYGFGWSDSGNGCRGVNRTAVLQALKGYPH